ncbi:MAG: IS256 family transposase [Bacteroidetes bacterium]|nr:IS256 family transposase [Bacteroidota bacterium]
MENRIKFTTQQLQVAINTHLEQDNGMSELFGMVINGLMYGERENFLCSSENKENKGNGYRKLLKAGMGSGLELKVPRDRLGIFRPVLLGVMEQQEQRIKDLSFSLYGKGLTTRQIGDVLTDIYGTGYSRSGISRITDEYREMVNSWMNRPLESHYPVVFIDATHVKVRRDTVATEAFYIVLGVKEDLTREVLAILNFPNESAAGWKEVLEGLKQRGLRTASLFVSDDLSGLDTSISTCFKHSAHQKCTIHFQRNLSKNIRVKDRDAFCSEIKEVFNPDDKNHTSTKAISELLKVLGNWVGRYPSLKQTMKRNDLELLFTYLRYDHRVRRMIYTTNWIERLNKSMKRTLKIRNALPSVEAAYTLMGYVAMEMGEKTYSYPVSSLKFDPILSGQRQS